MILVSGRRSIPAGHFTSLSRRRAVRSDPTDMESGRSHGHEREQEGIPKLGVHHYLSSDAHVLTADVIHVSDLTTNSAINMF